MSDWWEWINSAPEWIALSVALGGLAFQQAQINGLSNKLHECQRFMAERVATLERALIEALRE